jgi:hypothetical protein
MFYNAIEPHGILVISRPKGFFRHYGVHVPGYGVVEFGDWGVRAVTFEQFAAGRDVKIEREILMSQYLAVTQRLQQALAYPQRYDLGTWNCEDFANWLVDGKASSTQVNNVLAWGALIGGIAVMGRLG